VLFWEARIDTSPRPLPGRGGEGDRKGAASRHNRVETERFKSFTYDELLKRDKVNWTSSG